MRGKEEGEGDYDRGRVGGWKPGERGGLGQQMEGWRKRGRQKFWGGCSRGGVGACGQEGGRGVEREGERGMHSRLGDCVISRT